MSTTPLPPEPTPDKSPSVGTKPARLGRFVIGVNVVIQIVVVLAIVMIANHLNYRHFKRWDLSRNQKFALSSQTKNLLAHLDAPVHAIVFFPQAQALIGDVAGLLREYEYASNKKFTVEMVDPYRNLTRAKELSEQYKFGASDNIVILDYKGKSKFLNAQDMAEFDNADPMSRTPPTIRAFKGEETVTSALLEITEEKQTKLYFVGGHGEATMTDGSLAGLKFYLDRQNLKTQPLNLNNVDSVPADASGLIIFGPKSDFSEREVKLLDGYWSENKGRLFLLLDPTAKTTRLNEWLTAQGVSPQGDRVIKTGTVLTPDENGSLHLKNGIISSPMGVFVPSGKTITKDVAGSDTQMLGATQSLVLDRTKAQTDKIQALPLLETDDKYWGSATYVPGETRQVFFDPKKDHPGPLTLAVAVEKGALGDQRVKMETARMVIAGNSGFLTDRGLQQAPTGSDFAMNALNWMVNREEIAGIAAKPKAPVRLSLKEGEMNRISLLVMGIIPSLAAMVGILVWWQRRA